MNKLTRDFYLQDTVTVAKLLLGKTIVVNNNGQILKGIITETEAYLGKMDKACHSFGGKRTKRTEVMYTIGGHAYVYFIYGMFYCFNVVTENEDNPCAVLIRGVKPIENLDTLSQNRYNKNYNDITKKQQENISNGPGKFCKAFGITKAHNNLDLCGNTVYLCNNHTTEHFEIHSGKRINIDHAKEAADLMLRFWSECELPLS